MPRNRKSKEGSVEALLLLVLRIWAIILPLTIAAPTIRRNAEDVPPAQIAGGKCRMRINEINIYPSGRQQFLELIRICEKDPDKVFDVTMEDLKKKQSFYKLAFITPDAKLIGVCNLRGKATVKQSKYIFYTVGAEGHTSGSGRDMGIEDCNFALDHPFSTAPNRFPIGENVPTGVALIFNQSPSVIAAISLDAIQHEQPTYKAVNIDHLLKKKIIENMQDFLVYSSSSPYSDCEYFKQYYTGYSWDKGFYIIRDWAQSDDEMDFSRSRCPSQGSQTAWLPFTPNEYFYAPSSPNKPNVCERKVHFIIEEQQEKRLLPLRQYLPLSQYSCDILTEDNSIDRLNTITDPMTYTQKLKSALKGSLEELSKAVEAVAPQRDNSEPCDIDPYIDTTAQLPVADQCDDDVSSSTTGTAPVDQEIFERKLETSAPFIWESCTRFQPSSLIQDLQKQANPWISPEAIMQKDVCNWFQYLAGTTKFKCRLCSLLLEQGIIAETKGSKILTKVMKEGQGYSGASWAKGENSKILERHKENPLHKIALDYFTLYDSGKRGTDLTLAFERADGLWRKHLNATENHFVNVLQSTRLDVPFEKYEIEVETLVFYGVNMGKLYHNAAGNKLILMSLSQTIHNDFVTELKNQRPVLSVMVDTSTDIASMASLAIVFHIFGHQAEVQVRLYRVLYAKEGETGEALFELFKKALTDDGLEDFVKERCIGFSSDGGSNMKKFRRLLDDYTTNKLATVHCMAHRLELAIKKAWKGIPFLAEITELVNTVNTMFNSRSAKKKLILAETAQQQGDRKFETKRIISTRWMASKARALDNIFSHWKAIVSALSQIRVDKSFKLEQRVKASYAYEMLKNPTTVSTISFLADACEVIGQLSLKLQERGTSIIGKKEKREMLQEALNRLQTDNGPRLDFLLKKSRIHTEEESTTNNGVSLEDFEQKSTVYQEIVFVPSDPDSLDQLSKNRVKYLQPVIDQIFEYFPEDTTDSFDILDPTLWSKATLQNFGDSELKELNAALLWSYDWNILREGWKTLKQSVYSHEKFQEKKKETPESFWKYFLEDQLIPWTPEMKLIVKNILTIQSSTAEVERVYSMYTHTKTPQRYSLDVSTVDAIVRVHFNGPRTLQDFQPTKFAKRFVAEHSRADDEFRRTTWKKRGREDDDTAGSDDIISQREKSVRTDMVVPPDDVEMSGEEYEVFLGF